MTTLLKFDIIKKKKIPNNIENLKKKKIQKKKRISKILIEIIYPEYQASKNIEQREKQLNILSFGTRFSNGLDCRQSN